jgi:DNA (cytosine-5)-methyltransferase 1
MQLTAVSLFAGVGGFDLAMQRQGIDVKAAVEIDKKAREVLAKQFPSTKLFDDVKEVTGEQLRATGFIPERGIITGGFPCQDLSIAGLRKGLAGERSGLFHEIIRLADELRPQMFVLENVPGLLSSQQGKDMGIVITALVERGYGVCWRVLDSQNFGVPQRRRRVFIVASLGNHRQPVEVLFERESSQWNFEALGKTRKAIANRAEESLRTFVKAKRAQTVDDDESWVEKETVPTLNAFDIGDTRTTTAILFQGNRVGDPRFYEDGISPTVLNRWGTGGNNVPLMLSHGGEQANTITASIYHKQTVVNQDVSSGHLLHNDFIVRRLTPKECERLQGFPDDWTADQADSNRYKQMGNAVTVPVAEWIMKRVVKYWS